MEKIKAGIRTSEFWLALLTAILTVFNKHLGLNIPVESLVTIASIVITYIISRTVVKKQSE
jgi:putative flippase GtrA